MEHKIFKEKPLKSASFFKKLTGGKEKENVIIEINNLLARKDLNKIGFEEVQKIASDYQVDLSQEFNQERMDLYREYLTATLDDNYLSDEEIVDLKHLKFLLKLKDSEVEAAHQKMASQIYKKEVEKVIEDHEVDEQERNFMEKLQKDLRLPKDIADKIFKVSGEQLIKQAVNSALEDKILTPEEEQELQTIALNLNAEINLDKATQANLQKYKLYWQIENGALPELEADIPIPRKEKVHFIAPIKWYENKHPASQRVYSRSGLKIKINKGDYWRIPASEAKPLDQANWNLLDEGKLYLTNKRIFFESKSSENKVLLLNRVLDFVVFSNGIELDKESGQKDIFLVFDGNSDMFSMMLGKAILSQD